MKKITQKLIVVMSLFITATTACNKTVTPKPEPPATTGALSKIEIEGDIVNITYNSDGTIQKVVNQSSTNATTTTYVFNYENGKLKEINFGGKWKYSYNGDQLIKVETITADGKTRYQSSFSYVNNRVGEKIEYRVNDVLGLIPQAKTQYQYFTNGNVSKKEVFQYINNDW